MSQSESQKITLGTYEQGLESYMSGTASIIGDDFTPFLSCFADKFGDGTEILEIGVGTGRDADYLEQLGLEVVRTDAVEAFVHLQKEKGKSAQKFNILTDNLHRTFQGILAQAVFLHFTEEEFVIALQNIRKHLVNNGFFALSVKAGEGERYETHKFGKERYFKYWSLEELIKILEENNFKITDIFRPKNGEWIQVITKQSAV